MDAEPDAGRRRVPHSSGSLAPVSESELWGAGFGMKDDTLRAKDLQDGTFAACGLLFSLGIQGKRDG